MKTVLVLRIPEHAKVIVQVGDIVSPSVPVAEVKKQYNNQILPLASLFKIHPKKILSILTKQPGDTIFKGEILASRKSLFSHPYVKSPCNGKILEVDLNKGIVTLEDESASKGEKLVFPFSGRVIKIYESSVEIEVDHPIYPLISSQGVERSAPLFVHHDTIDMFSLSGEEKGSIIVCKSVSLDAYMKLSVMDVVGLICCDSLVKSTSFPTAQVLPDVLEKLSLYHGISALLQPIQKRIIVMQSSYENHT